MHSVAVQSTTKFPIIMRLPEVMRVIGLSRASIYRMVESGDLPRQLKIGTSAVGWLKVEIEDWVIRRANLREVRYATTAA